ncbi:hypothetical protein D064_02211 [Streptococcus mitis 11/5]|uniref:Uncharacterized protein n=1 Tax=Streptococcus mitis 11/5 TaxID=1239792 RepID=R0LIT5_STRMT|nr:hypothetical protein D064_02211 [Streptococcus mitis 11/5]
MAKKSMIAKNKRPAKSLLKLILVVKNVVVHIQFTANLNFAVFASVN